MNQPPRIKSTDRYVSFDGIDCDGDARRLMEHIERLLDMPGRSNAFWEYFMNKRAGAAAGQPDDLFLIHSNINQVRELFETWDDRVGLDLLSGLEQDCC